MELTDPIAWSDCLRDECPGRQVWIAHPDGEALGTIDFDATQPTLILIGPEGGFTDQEVTEAADQGARRINLGPRILRIETAVIAIAAWLALRKPDGQ